MERSRVYFARCREYDSARIGRMVSDGIGWLGIELPWRSKVLLKPNVLGAFAPERHITTHPAVVEAVLRLLLDNGNEVVIADSSSVPGRTGHAMEQAGIAELARKHGRVTAVPFEELPTRRFDSPGNVYLPHVNLARVLDEVECIVNVPKFKTHTLTRLTVAVKNLFGCIPGGGKQQAHVRAPSAPEFSQLLVDLYGYLKPQLRLHVLDGIVGLDGFGPGTAGQRNATGFLALSGDAVALDMACSALVRVDPLRIWTSRYAIERGLAVEGYETNEQLDPVRFRLPAKVPLLPFFFRHVSGLQRRRPAVDEAACRQCGICARACPVRCIMMDGLPRWDYGKCIYCYCCHESCPHAAIKLKRSLSHLRELGRGRRPR